MPGSFLSCVSNHYSNGSHLTMNLTDKKYRILTTNRTHFLCQVYTCFISFELPSKAYWWYLPCFLDKVTEAQLSSLSKFSKLMRGKSTIGSHTTFGLKSLLLTESLQIILLPNSTTTLLCDLKSAPFPLWVLVKAEVIS